MKTLRPIVSFSAAEMVRPSHFHYEADGPVAEVHAAIMQALRARLGLPG